jgi:hypothetical protein
VNATVARILEGLRLPVWSSLPVDNEWERNIHEQLDATDVPRRDINGRELSLNGRFELLRMELAELRAWFTGMYAEAHQFPDKGVMIEEYKQVQQGLLNHKCPGCGKSKMTGLPLCKSCWDHELTQNERRSFSMPIKRRYAKAYLRIIPALVERVKTKEVGRV